ncbi:cyclophilin-like fold protein [bacterium RCC_150]
MTTSSPPSGAPITLDIEGEAETATLPDNAAARQLMEQLPLTLSFTDFGRRRRSQNYGRHCRSKV